MTAGMAEFLEIRLALFRLLQAAYAAPVTPEVATALAELAAAYHQLVARDLPPLAPPEPDAVAEFHRLFVGPGPLVAPPYESVYRSPEPLLMQEETLAVRAFYRSHGLALRAGRREPDDHLAIELEFYARLQEEGQVEDQYRFWDQHLRRWVPDFCGRLAAGSRSPFYRSLAAITREAILAEEQVLAALLE